MNIAADHNATLQAGTMQLGRMRQLNRVFTMAFHGSVDNPAPPDIVVDDNKLPQGKHAQD